MKTVPHTRSIDGKTMIAVVCSGAWNSSQKTMKKIMVEAGVADLDLRHCQ